MRWRVILASLKQSHSSSVSYHHQSKTASLQSRTSPLENPKFGPSPSTPHIFAIPKSSKSSSSRIIVRNATTTTKSGKAFSVSQADSSVKVPKEKAPSVSQAESSVKFPKEKAPSTQDNTNASRSSSRKTAPYAKKGTLSASEVVQRDLKAAAYVRDEKLDIADLNSPRRHVSRESANQAEGRSSRRSSAQGKTTRKKIADEKIAGGPDVGKVSTRRSKVTTSSNEGKVRSYESLLDASVATRESGCSSKGQVVSGSDSSESRLDCLAEAEISPEGICEGGRNVGGEPKKPFLQIAFPVSVFAEWWFYCFVKGLRPYPDLIYPLNRLYVWLGAYQRVHQDATGIYVDGHAVATMSKQLEVLKNAVTSRVFKWGDAENIYIPSPLDILKENLLDVDTNFSFQDRVVQEVLYLILEPIFEARFSTRSHASRPGRDVHTALRAARRSFLGCTWFISGDLSVLHEDRYAAHLVESVLEVVKDSRIAILLRRGFLGGMARKAESQRICSSFTSATQGSCGRLKHLLCNVLLDPLDWWMDEQINNLSKREQPPDQSPTNVLFMPAKASVKRPRKLEYVRYGTKFWVGCNGINGGVDSIQKNIMTLLEQKFGKDVQSNLSVSHISAGVNILDHVISEKIVRPICIRRRASSGRVFEKRAFRIKVCVKASIESCSNYLKQVRVPASLQHIDEVLSALNHWYCYAENKEKVLEFCKLILCYMYSKGIIDKCKDGTKEIDFPQQFKKDIRTVLCPNSEDGHPGGGKNFIRIPEHEKLLRDHAWLQSIAVTNQFREIFRNMRKHSPQQSMSQVLWHFLRTGNGDNGWDLEDQMQTSSPDEGSVVNVKFEELAESVG